jgi:N-acetylglutamate synthase-like GNAT family acetyltransferase
MNIRPATQTDQSTITRLIRDAGINPMSLDWQRFVIAEDNGAIVGIGQVKQHSDGSHELASIAVIPSRQKQGVAGEIIRHLLAKETGVVHLTCRSQLETFYVRFGFRKIARDEMTPYFGRIIRLVNALGGLRGIKIIVMKRDA